MKFIKNLLFLFCTLATGTAFSQSKCYATQGVNGASGSTTTYTYDNNNHINGFTMAGGGVTANYTVTTNEQGYVTAINIQGTALNGFVLSKAILAYDKSNNLVKEEVFLGTGTTPTVTEIRKYNATGQMHHMQQVSSWPMPGGKFNVTYNYNIFTYPNTTTKNPSKISIYGGTATAMKPNADQIIELTYDNQKISDYPGSANEYEAFATNNVTKAAITYVASEVNEDRVSTFEYNAQGYPVSKTYKANGGKTCVDTYTYNCK